MKASKRLLLRMSASKPLFAAIAAAPLLLLSPLIASAQASITHNPTSPQPGFPTYSDNGGGGNRLSNYNSLYGAALKADALANGNQFAGMGGTAPTVENGANSYVAHYFNHGYPDNAWGGTAAGGTQYRQTTFNRLCYLLDTSYPDPTATGSGSIYNYVSGSADDNTLLYDGSRWYLLENDKHYTILGLGGTNAGTVISSLLCTSYSLPVQTLAASTYTIAAGDPVTLTWNDGASRDQVWPSDTNHSGGGGYSPGGPVTTCTSSGPGFNLPQTSQPVCRDWESCADFGRSCSGSFCNEPGTVTATMPSSGSVTVNPTQTTTYTYSCTNPNGTTIANATVNVSAPTNPDLVAGGVTPTSAVPNSNVSLTATITNQGNAATNGGFNNLFEINPNSIPSTFSSIQTVRSRTLSGLGANASSPVSVQYSFPSAGTWYVRACANTNTLNTQDVTESNYANNCGAWTAVNVAAVPTYAVLSVGSINAKNVAIGPNERVRTLAASITGWLKSLTSVAHADATVAGQPLQLSTNITNSGSASNATFTNYYFIDVNNDNASAQPGSPVSSWDLSYPVTQSGISANSVVVSAATIRNTPYSSLPGLPEGTHGIVFCADWNGNVSDPAQAVTARCTAKIVSYVGPAPAPDLTGGAVSPTSAVIGTTATFSATITNGGTLGTSAGFTNLFQKANDSIGNGAADVGTGAVNAVAMGGTATASFSYAFPSADAGTTRYLRVCADKATGADTTGSVAESNETNNCGPWTAVTVAGLPDLTAGAVSPGSATAGTSATFASTITNNGNASSGAGFANLFQRATDSGGSNAADIGTAATGAVGAGGGTALASLSYTFPVADAGTTRYLRVCADKSSAVNPGAITESNEANNCGAWTPIIVGGAACISTPNACGQTNSGTTLSSGACSASPPANPAGYGNACVSAANSCGQTNSGTITCSGTCSATAPTDASCPPTASLSASPATIDAGQTTKLFWSSTFATRCVSQSSGFSTSNAANNPTTGVQVGPLATNSTYQIVCYNAAGTPSAPSQATVTVLQPTASITASPVRVTSGSSSTITWTSALVTSCTVAGPGLASTLGNGSRTIPITAQSTYTIDCKTHGSDLIQSVIVNVFSSSFEEF